MPYEAALHTAPFLNLGQCSLWSIGIYAFWP